MTELAQHIDKLQSDIEADRIYAAEDIGYANEAAGIDPLVARLPAETSRAVRETIFAALLQIDDNHVIEAAIAMLDSDDPFLRNQSVEMLRVRGAAAIPYLDRAFREGDNDRRKFVIDVLAKLSASDESTSYALALEDRDINVVITAVESLGETHKVAFRDRIQALVSSNAHPMLLCACMDALAQIGDVSSLPSVQASLGPAAALPGYLLPSYLKLVGAVGQTTEVPDVSALLVRPALVGPVLNALTALRARFHVLALPPDIAQPLLDIVAANQSAVHSYQAIRILGLLLAEPQVFQLVAQSLQHPDKSIRIGAVQAMRESGLEQAVAVLRERLADETDEEVLQAWGGESEA